MEFKISIVLILPLLILLPIHYTIQPPTEMKEFIYFERVTIVNNGSTPVMLEDYYRYFTLFINTSNQASFLINSTPSILRFFKDEDRMLNIELNITKTINPYSYIQMSTTHKIIIYGSLNPPENLSVKNSGTLKDIPESLRNYTMPIGTWMYNSTWMRYLKDKAWELKGDDENVLSIVLKFIDWIGKNVKYPDEPLKGPLYPNETLPIEKIQQGELGIGDCDDQANLLITLCRSVGIPAYLQYGCIYFKNVKYYDDSINGHLNFRYHYIGWHGWAVVYIPPWDWLPVDLTWGYLVTKNPIDAIAEAATYQCWKIGVPILIHGNIVNSDHVKIYKEMEREIGNSSIYMYIDNILIPINKPLSKEIEQLPVVQETFSSTITTYKPTTTVTSKPIEYRDNAILVVVLSIASSIALYIAFKRRSYTKQT